MSVSHRMLDLTVGEGGVQTPFLPDGEATEDALRRIAGRLAAAHARRTRVAGMASVGVVSWRAADRPALVGRVSAGRVGVASVGSSGARRSSL